MCSVPKCDLRHHDGESTVHSEPPSALEAQRTRNYMNRYFKNARALTSAAVMTALLGGCASASESTAPRADEPTLTKKAGKASLTVVSEAAPSDALTCGTSTGSKGELSDKLEAHGDATGTERSGARPCNAAELSIAADHCAQNHTGGYDPIANGYWPCEMTGCMVRGGYIVYSWAP